METLKPLNILLIEDNAGDARLITEHVKDAPEVAFHVERASQLQEALTYLSQHEVDVILLDLSLPDSPGLETFQRLKAQTTSAPVVVLTGFDNEAMALDAVREGAQDYLIKGQVDPKTLTRTILYAIERHRSQSTLRSLSLTDELTGLYNRRGFMTLGEQALKSALRAKSSLFMFYVDLDGLKKINDNFGHADGDRAISAAAEVLKKTFRQADIVARIGGDEFAVLAAADQDGGCDILMSRLYGNLAHYNLQNPRAYKVSLSIGSSRFNPEAPVKINELMSQADKVLYIHKEKNASSRKRSEGKKRYWLWMLPFTALFALGIFQYARQLRSPSIAAKSTPHPSSVPAPAATSSILSRVAPPTSVSIPIQRPTKTPKPVLPDPTPVQKATEPPASEWRSTSPSTLKIHGEMIPKETTITSFSYEERITSPGSVLAFNIVGSGFTNEFQQTLAVYSGSPHVQVRGLHRVTVNQIQGEMVIHPQAPTQYVFPQVLIHGTPVFQTLKPFAIIRKGEVLNIVFTHMEEGGHTGHFHIYTNLDASQSARLRVQADAPGLEISALTFTPPYLADGTLRIGNNVPRGEYGLKVMLGSNEIYHKERMVQIAGPNLGQIGNIQELTVEESFRRPGDPLVVFLLGSGFTPSDAALLSARVDGFPSEKALFAYLSPGRLKASIRVPSTISPGFYPVAVEEGGKIVYMKKEAFSVVPPNWMESIQVTPPARSGQKSVLTLLGRDFSREFASGLHVRIDEPGVKISPLQWADASTLTGEIEIDGPVATGNYLLNMTYKGSTIRPESGSLIQVQAR